MSHVSDGMEMREQVVCGPGGAGGLRREAPGGRVWEKVTCTCGVCRLSEVLVFAYCFLPHI